MRPPAVRAAMAKRNKVTPALALMAATGSPDSRNNPARVPPQLGQATPVTRRSGHRLGWWFSCSATKRVAGLASTAPAHDRRAVLAFTYHRGFRDVVPHALTTWDHEDQNCTDNSDDARDGTQHDLSQAFAQQHLHHRSWCPCVDVNNLEVQHFLCRRCGLLPQHDVPNEPTDSACHDK